MDNDPNFDLGVDEWVDEAARLPDFDLGRCLVRFENSFRPTLPQM